MAVTLVLLTSCSGDDGAAQVAPSASASASAGGGTEQSRSADGSGAGVEPFDLKTVMVEQTVALPESPQDQLTLGVQSLRVQGKVMVLRMVVTPHLASQPPTESVSLFKALGDHLFRPTLVDRTNLKEYSPIGSGQTWVSDEIEVSAVNGSPMPAWAYFAAPQDDISVIDLRLSDGWPGFTDVPIER